MSAKPGRPATAMEAMDAFGVDAVCEAIMDRKSLTLIASEAGTSLTTLLRWLDADSERSARVREARSAMGKIWDERAESVIEDAQDEFELKKAKELAHHYRWRSAKVAPRDYGDKIDLNHGGSIDANIRVTFED